MRKLLFISAVAMFPTAFAGAAMYKCEEDGRVTYQGTPCNGTGTQISAPVENPAASSKGTPNDPSAIAAKFDEQAKRLVLEQKKRDLDYEIKNLEEEIARQQSAMNAELDDLKKRKELWKNALGGQTQERSIANEMQTVTEKYKTKIQSAQDELSQRQKEKAAIDSQLSVSGNGKKEDKPKE